MLRWMECHSGVSSYIQAAGAIAALALAIWIPWRENQRAKRRAEELDAEEKARAVRRAVSILTGLLGEMVALQVEVDRVRSNLGTQLLNPPHLDYRGWFISIRLVIPQELQQSLLHVADVPVPAAEAVVDAIARARNYNGQVARYETAARTATGQDWFDVVTAMQETLKLVEASVTAYLDSIAGPK
jgi:hypothetical protein